MATRRTRITTRVEHDRGVFMISVAAELAEMHPQTLRMYEARGLIEPKRSPKGTRLYSQADVDRLRRIQEMTTEWGMNLAGVEKVFAMQAGREIRVMVLPDAVDDIAAQVMARDIAKQVEEELTYPGQIRVTVVRESRATEVAK